MSSPLKNVTRIPSAPETTAPAKGRWDRFWTILLLAAGLWHFHAQEFTSKGDLVRGDRVDARFSTFILEHETKAVTGGADFTAPPLFFPLKNTLGYSDTYLALLPPYALFRWAGFDSWTAIQGVGVVCDLLAFLLAYGFLRRGLGSSALSASIGAAFFAFAGARYQQINHLQSQAGFLLPGVAHLVAAGWRRAASGRGRPGLFLFGAGLAAALQCLTCFYLGWFLLFMLGLFLLLALLLPSTRPGFLKTAMARPSLFPSALAGLLIGLLPFFLIYGPILPHLPIRTYDNFLSLMPPLGAWFWMGPEHPIWGSWGFLLGMEDRAVAEWEMRMGWGLLFGGAVVFSGFWALVCAFREGRKAGEALLPALGALTLLLMALAVTRWGSFSPWRLVFEAVPGASAIRAVGRVHLALSLPASILLAWGVGEAQRRLSGWKPEVRTAVRTLAALVLVTALFEQFMGPPCAAGFSAAKERAWMKNLVSRIPEKTDAFYLSAPKEFPATSDELSVDALGAAVFSGIPTLNGYSGNDPPGWRLHWLKMPDYKSHVERWVQENGVTGNVVELRLGGNVKSGNTPGGSNKKTKFDGAKSGY